MQLTLKISGGQFPCAFFKHFSSRPLNLDVSFLFSFAGIR